MSRNIKPPHAAGPRDVGKEQDLTTVFVEEATKPWRGPAEVGAPPAGLVSPMAIP